MLTLPFAVCHRQIRKHWRLQHTIWASPVTSSQQGFCADSHRTPYCTIAFHNFNCTYQKVLGLESFCIKAQVKKKYTDILTWNSNEVSTQFPNFFEGLASKTCLEFLLTEFLSIETLWNSQVLLSSHQAILIQIYGQLDQHGQLKGILSSYK